MIPKSGHRFSEKIMLQQEAKPERDDDSKKSHHALGVVVDIDRIIHGRTDMSGSDLPKGITPAGSGKAGEPKEVVWSILGHTYWLKADSKDCFIFETLDPPGTFVPPHIHPTQDEYIYMLEGTFDLYLDGSWTKANVGDLVRMPRGLPHGYYNRQDKPARALFSVSPARRLRELFDQLHNLADPAEVVRRSKICEVDFLPPGSVPGA
jgi:quercetin dioxygenase-like cupin family protein